MPGQDSQERTTTLTTAYDPNEDYTQPTIDIKAISDYLRKHVLFEEWLSAHPDAA